MVKQWVSLRSSYTGVGVWRRQGNPDSLQLYSQPMGESSLVCFTCHCEAV